MDVSTELGKVHRAARGRAVHAEMAYLTGRREAATVAGVAEHEADAPPSVSREYEGARIQASFWDEVMELMDRPDSAVDAAAAVKTVQLRIVTRLVDRDEPYDLAPVKAERDWIWRQEGRRFIRETRPYIGVADISQIVRAAEGREVVSVGGAAYAEDHHDACSCKDTGEAGVTCFWNALNQAYTAGFLAAGGTL